MTAARKENLAVARESWADGDGVISKNVFWSDGQYMMSRPLFPKLPERKTLPYIPTDEDMAADDWTFLTAKVKS